ncbi:2-hydroxyacid dehydrogenase [Roseibium sediminis]|uniref:2-hydroxyacid dehydrogenase n=1 Tax=Roseibium sediminis TaxID=1775174 RepID=UPI00123CE890|nr:2-hydroxyacid dehydrogenase [Roseibium sediminis]
MTTEVAIIGDRFMLSSMFEEALRDACGDRITCRKLDLPWPDEPMEHGYAVAGLEGLKEYMGTPEQVLEHLGNAPILVTHLAPLPEAVFASAPNLKMVAVSRGGPVNVSMQSAADHKVLVVNTPGRNASAVAEFTIGAVIAETRNITRGHDALRKGEYRGDLYRADVTGDELSDMTVGIIGYGEVGTRVVRLLRAFGTRILVCDPYVQLTVEDKNAGVEHVSLDTLLEQSDLVSLHPRVTSETRGMIGAEQIAKMKKGSVLVNTARGPLLDYDALYEALVSGHLRGAMLETFAIEPTPPDWPLLQLPNVTLTPHIAGASLKTVRIAAAKAAEEVRRWLDGEPPVNPC